MAFKLTQDRSDTGNYPDSYYHSSKNRDLNLSPLDGSCRTDVCIIGGGYTGLSCALQMAKRGYKVVLLEARKPGWGASGRNGGQLGSGQRKNQIDLEKRLGFYDAQRFWNLAQDAKELAKTLIREYQIDCDLKPGVAHPDHNRSGTRESEVYRSFGFDVIGMTNLQEAKLAREAEMSYATLAMVTDYDCWHEDEADVSGVAVMEVIQQNVRTAQEAVRSTIARIPRGERSQFVGLLAQSLITEPSLIPPSTLEALRPIIGPYIDGAGSTEDGE